ncbi:hypothetical protein ACWGIB_23870 [Streptomyces xiamenensis]
MGAMFFAVLAVAGQIERNYIREKSLEGQVTAATRKAVLPPHLLNTGLAKDPSSLRPAGLSGQLSAGVAPQTVAQRAGHTVEVLLRVYARFVHDTDEDANRRIGEWPPALELTPSSAPSGVPERGGDGHCGACGVGVRWEALAHLADPVCSWARWREGAAVVDHALAPVSAFVPGLTCGISVPASGLRRDCPTLERDRRWCP